MPSELSVSAHLRDGDGDGGGGASGEGGEGGDGDGNGGCWAVRAHFSGSCSASRISSACHSTDRITMN
jgi:hypothetical protein